jgi:hypothetical protein
MGETCAYLRGDIQSKFKATYVNWPVLKLMGLTSGRSGGKPTVDPHLGHAENTFAPASTGGVFAPDNKRHF